MKDRESGLSHRLVLGMRNDPSLLLRRPSVVVWFNCFLSPPKLEIDDIIHFNQLSLYHLFIIYLSIYKTFVWK